MIGNKILTVCIGNICRSPAAEGFFADYFKKQDMPVGVDSAGICALVGEGPAAYTESIMHEIYGIDVSEHRAQQLTSGIVMQFDVIFVMTEDQAVEVKKTYPFASGKVFALGKWRKTDIADPYRKPKAVFQECLALIQACTNDWITRFWPEKET